MKFDEEGGYWSFEVGMCRKQDKRIEGMNSLVFFIDPL